MNLFGRAKAAPPTAPRAAETVNEDDYGDDVYAPPPSTPVVIIPTPKKQEEDEEVYSDRSDPIPKGPPARAPPRAAAPPPRAAATLPPSRNAAVPPRTGAPPPPRPGPFKQSAPQKNSKPVSAPPVPEEEDEDTEDTYIDPTLASASKAPHPSVNRNVKPGKKMVLPPVTHKQRQQNKSMQKSVPPPPQTRRPSGVKFQQQVEPSKTFADHIDEDGAEDVYLECDTPVVKRNSLQTPPPMQPTSSQNRKLSGPKAPIPAPKKVISQPKGEESGDNIQPEYKPSGVSTKQSPVSTPSTLYAISQHNRKHLVQVLPFPSVKKPLEPSLMTEDSETNQKEDKLSFQEQKISSENTFKQKMGDYLAATRLKPRLPLPVNTDQEDNNLSDKEWFAGNCDRKTAEATLRKFNMNGAFSVRQSSGQRNDQPYTLVVLNNGRVYNIPVRYVETQQKYALGKEKRINEEYFNSIANMIEHYQCNPLILVDGKNHSKEMACLSYPVQP
ncbi:SH2 domain-containing protein 6 [Protopterus annectens]|uniref:SH2 domain-containing protein 6 n=1 Tax=Protopterus annectens TaxID=7888 RepID=UPI001CF9387C|nr:SH2 domain-containing protein 6 [Protopterus annectens]